MQKLVDEAMAVSDGDLITDGDHSKMKTTTDIDPIETTAHLIDHGFVLCGLRQSDGAFLFKLEESKVDWIVPPMSVEVGQDGLMKIQDTDEAPTDFWTWNLKQIEKNDQ